MKSSIGLGSAKQGFTSHALSSGNTSIKSTVSSRPGLVSGNIICGSRSTRQGSNLSQVTSTNRNTSTRLTPDLSPRNSTNSPCGVRKVTQQTVPTNKSAKDSVLFRKPLNPNPVNTSSSNGEKESSIGLRPRPPSSLKSLSTNNTSKQKPNTAATNSPVTIRKAASSLGVHTIGVVNRNASRNPRALQAEGNQPLVGILGKASGVTSSRSVDSLNNHKGAKNETAGSGSPLLSPRVEIEKLKNLHQKIAKLKQDLDLNEQLRDEKQSQFTKADVHKLPAESDNLPISSFIIPASKPEIQDVSDNQSHDFSGELNFFKNECKELQTKYTELQKNFDYQRIENERLSRAESDAQNYKDGYERLRFLLDEERTNIASERLDWKSFQDDLLTVVRAANDYKTEAQEKLEAMEVENVALREKILLLEANNKILTETFRRRPTDNPIPLLTESKSNKRDIVDVIEEVQLLDMATNPSKDNEENAPFDNNKENCAANGYNNQWDCDAKTQNSNSKRVIGSFLVSTKKPEIANGSVDHDDDPLVSIVKATGSRRNALLRWCQGRTAGYKHVEITNFSTSWSNGMALCALLHSHLPDNIVYDSLKPENCEENFDIAFKAAESVGVATTLSIEEMVANERPSWEKVMNYVKDIYTKIEAVI